MNKDGNLPIGLGIPEPGSVVPGSAHDASPIRTEFHIVNDIAMAGEYCDRFQCVGIPDPHGRVLGRCDYPPSIRTKINSVHGPGMSQDDSDLSARIGLPDSHRAVVGCSHDTSAVWAERGGYNRCLVTQESHD